MSFHKGICGQSEGGGSAKDLTLGDYINRIIRNQALDDVAQERKLSFREWYIRNELLTYNKTEYDCMEMAWKAGQENK